MFSLITLPQAVFKWAFPSITLNYQVNIIMGGGVLPLDVILAPLPVSFVIWPLIINISKIFGPQRLFDIASPFVESLRGFFLIECPPPYIVKSSFLLSVHFQALIRLSTIWLDLDRNLENQFLFYRNIQLSSSPVLLDPSTLEVGPIDSLSLVG